MTLPSIGLGVGTTAQGTAGGGNVFNQAPLFGNSEISGSGSSGPDGASALATTSASGQGGSGGGAASLPQLPGSASPASAPAVNLTAYLPYFLVGGVIVLGVWLVTRLFAK